MVHCYPAFVIFVIFEHREVYYPEEGEFVFVDQVTTFTHFETERTESLCYDRSFVGDDEEKVARFCLRRFFDICQDLFGEEFRDRRFDAFFRIADPSQTFCTVDVYEFNETVEFAARNVGVTFDVDRFYDTACLKDRFEYFEVRTANSIGDVCPNRICPSLRPTSCGGTVF